MLLSLNKNKPLLSLTMSSLLAITFFLIACNGSAETSINTAEDQSTQVEASAEDVEESLPTPENTAVPTLANSELEPTTPPLDLLATAQPEATKETEPEETAVADTNKESTPEEGTPESWHPIRSLGIHATYAVDFSSDGTTALLGANGFISLVDLNDFTSQQIFIGDGVIRELHASPDGEQILVGFEYAPPLLLDRTTGELLQIFETLDTAPLAFSPDGTKLAGRRDNEVIEVWDIATHQLVATMMGHTSRIDALDFSPEGTLLASASADRTARIWNVSTGEEISKLEHFNDVSAVAFAPNGQYLATHNKLWDVATSEEIDTSSYLWSGEFVIFSPNSQVLAAVASTGRADVIAVDSWESIYSFAGSNQHNKAAFTPDGQYLLVGSDLWDTNSGEQAAELGGHSSDIFYSTLSADGKFAATGSIDDTIKVWDVETGSTIYTLVGDDDSFHASAFSPDNTKLLANDGDDIRMWDMNTGEELLTIHHTFSSEDRRPVGFLPDGSKFFTTDEDGNLALYDSATGDLVQSFDHDGAEVYAASFAPHGQTAITGSQTRDGIFVRLWDITDGQLLQELSLTDAGRIETVAFSPDGTQFISLENGRRGGDPSILRVWNTSTGQEINTIMTEDVIISAAYFPDGQQVLVGGLEGAFIIDIVSGQIVESVVGRSSIYFNDIDQVAVSANGERILLGSSKQPFIFEKIPFVPLTHE